MNKTMKFSCFIFFAMLSYTAPAQVANFSGIVLNEVTREPVPAAIVTDVNSGKRAITNPEGYFSMNLPTGAQEVTVSTETGEYYLATLSLNVPSDKKIKHTFRLSPAKENQCEEWVAISTYDHPIFYTDTVVADTSSFYIAWVEKFTDNMPGSDRCPTMNIAVVGSSEHLGTPQTAFAFVASYPNSAQSRPVRNSRKDRREVRGSKGDQKQTVTVISIDGFPTNYDFLVLYFYNRKTKEKYYLKYNGPIREVSAE